MAKSITKDMTEGNPFPLILKFSIPLVLGNLFQQLYNLVDTIIVGKVLGLNALTAVGATTSINFLIIGFVLGTCNGLGVPIAQHFGAKRYDNMRKYVANAAYFGIIMAVILTLATTLLCRQALTWMKTPKEIFEGSYAYFFVICLGIPFTILYNTCAAIIRALGDSRTPFLFLVLSTFLNIFMDLFFIIVLKSGVAGAAWATILAQGISGAVCFTYMIRKYDVLKFKDGERRLNGRCMKTLFVSAVPMGLQFSITAIGSIMMQSAVNMLDVVYVSAFAAGMKIKQLAICAYDGLATTCATFAGQNYGAGKIARVKKGVGIGCAIGVAYSVIVGILMITCGSKIALLFVDAGETKVLKEVQLYLTCTAFFYSFLVPVNCLRMTVQALGYGGLAMLSGVTELVARALMSVVITPMFGYIGVCFTDQAAWILATIVITTIYVVILKKLEKQIKNREGSQGNA